MNRTVRTILPVLVLAAGFAGAVGLVMSRKKPTRQKKAPLPPKVEVVKVSAQSAPAAVQALGTVVAAQTLTLQPEISGRVAFVHPNLEPGGTISKGEVLVRLDAREFKLAVDERKAAEAKAAFDLAVEEGRGRVAQREWTLVGADKRGSGTAGKALALREPHLVNARAGLAGAKAGVARAELNVARTVLRAPFDLLVREEAVEIGQIVNPQSRLATLVATSAFWVQTSVPLSSLRWIRTAADGDASEATVMLNAGDGSDASRAAQVLRLLGDLDPKGQMARVLVSVPDPLSLKSPGAPRLLLGAYVRVGIAGTALEDVYVVPRVALRQGDLLWVVDGERKLRIRETRLVWAGESEVYVRDGVAEGEQVIVSRLAAPVEGMPLRVAGASAATASAAVEGASR